jgi:galactosamine-6-phosphate isomerase
MNIDIVDSYKELSQKARDIIISEINKKKNILLCAATGGTPTGTYELLSEEYRGKPELFDQLRIIKLDEWGAMPMNHPATCEHYLQSHLIRTLHISASRYISFESNPTDPKKECERIQEKLDQEGPIDLCILGLGMNGHLAFIEPADYLQPYCHIARLSVESLKHQMVSEMQVKPAYGLTLGMADIMHSKRVLLLVNGIQKRTILSSFLSKRVSTSLPASFLWLHPEVNCLIEKNAME